MNSQCCSNCDQGRKPCPCPEACQRNDDPLDSAIGIVNGLVLALGIWVIVAAVWVALS